MPDRRASVVFLAMAARGLTISTMCSCAPRCDRASTEMSMPGAIAPPTYSPLGLTASNVVAVPKSTTTLGPPYRCPAASALMIRSLPTSLGLSRSEEHTSELQSRFDLAALSLHDALPISAVHHAVTGPPRRCRCPGRSHHPRTPPWG